MNDSLLIGIPKGSLEGSTISLFKKAGYRFYGSDRSLWLSSNDPELKPVLLRPQEIPLYVAKGSLDCGLAGWDWIIENNCNGEIQMLSDLCYSKRSFQPVKWVLAVAEHSPFQKVRDFRGLKPPVRISTELKFITENWLSERGIIADVRFSWGATEAKVPVFADAIVECTETGTSLQANGLRVIEVVIESTTRFFANKETFKKHQWKRDKLSEISLLLESCLIAETKLSLHAHILKSKLEIVKSLIPSTAQFMFWEGQDNLMYFEIIDIKDKIRKLVPTLARNGVQNISCSSLEILKE